MTAKKSIVILISGNGSNAQAIIEACERSEINGQVTCVLSNRPNAYGLTRAKNHNITNQVIDHKLYANRELFDQAMINAIDEYSPDVVVLAGFMRILTTQFVTHYAGRLLNIHPSLLPKYPGLNTYQRAIDAKEQWHGSSVHFVTDELDGGPIVLQSKVAIETNDTAESLAKKVAPTEWQIYPQVVAWYCADRLRLVDGMVYLDNKKIQTNGMIHDYPLLDERLIRLAH